MNDLLEEQRVTARLKKELGDEEGKRVPREELENALEELEKERAKAMRLEKEKESLEQERRGLEQLTAADDDEETKYVKQQLEAERTRSENLAKQIEAHVELGKRLQKEMEALRREKRRIAEEKRAAEARVEGTCRAKLVLQKAP